jgi:ribonuclease-3
MAKRRAAPSDEPATERRKALRRLARTLGHEFQDPQLLERALCHSSTGNEGKSSYERLEFLGDAVLGFLVADLLFDLGDDVPEGTLTDRRARIVSRAPLSGIADQLGLVPYLEVGRGLKEQERNSTRIKSDLVEAVLGAVYLDGGLRSARKFVRRHIWMSLKDLPGELPLRDTKTRLLHWIQGRGLGQPGYEVISTEGPPHARQFGVAVRVGGDIVADGSGRTKQEAEKNAAGKALVALGAEPGPRRPEPGSGAGGE